MQGRHSPLGGQVIQYKYAERWGGKLPIYSGGGITPMVNITH